MTVRMVNELRLFLPEKDILVGLQHLLRFLENYKRFLENQLNGAKTNWNISLLTTAVGDYPWTELTDQRVKITTTRWMHFGSSKHWRGRSAGRVPDNKLFCFRAKINLIVEKDFCIKIEIFSNTFCCQFHSLLTWKLHRGENCIRYAFHYLRNLRYEISLNPLFQ